MTRLARAAALFVAANILHTLDHLRQGIDRLAPEVLTDGALLSLAAVLALVLALRRDARAPVVCVGVGVAGALGIAAAHLAPHWSALSDPYPGLGLDALAWTVMLAEIAAGLVLAVAGAREVARARHATA
jgi:cephalosporin-C deacetylase-like acetyl esterase